MIARLLLCVFALFLIAASPAPQPVRSCADLTHAYPGAPCSLDLAGVRLSDPFLSLTSFPGHTYVVHGVKETTALKLAPGDQLVLAPGEWRDARLIVRADGTAERPILIRGDGAIFTGTGSAAFTGSNLIVRGLSFRNGAVTRDQFFVFRMGNSATDPCERCVADHIAIEGYNSVPEYYDTIHIYYVVLMGHGITLANSRLTAKRNSGGMVLTSLPHGAPQRLLLLDNTLSDFTAATPDHANQHLALHIGSGASATHSAYTAIIGNIFEGITGNSDTVALKASDIVVRGNIFRANRGALDLRAADRVLVENNVFDGHGIASMGGIHIAGAGHWIVHNLFRGLRQPENYYYWPIGIEAAVDENLRDGIEDYPRAKNIVIAGNRFENDNQPPIALGIYPDPSRGRTLMPRDIYLLANSFESKPIFYVGDPAQYTGIVVR